ncbi:unnamed protein product [Owenia fusiformis]|uniref:Uncharacterized protein n=1 Tax=Owenia fusiformis TaxID=6347 RepID=A0A8J1TS38_OWEFU|nr:unnamed protein product [Owenia fusiformis]
MAMQKQKVALITGANAGIGLAVAERLLQCDHDLRLCLACRNPLKATAAKLALEAGRPGATIDIVIVDVGCVKSVFKAVQEIKNRYSQLDYVFMNAGAMGEVKFNWTFLLKNLFSREVALHMFRTGIGLIEQVDSTTEEGLRQVFATNVFGHFIMLRELEALFGCDGQPTKIIWTSSSNAIKASFDINDLQHKNGNQCYSSSKYICDLLSLHINCTYNKQGIYSSVTNPGFVYTKMTNSILPDWLWSVSLWLLTLLRFLVPSMTISTYCGAESLIDVWRKPVESLDPYSKYYSNAGLFSKAFTNQHKLDVDESLAMQTFEKLDTMLEKVKRSEPPWTF